MKKHTKILALIIAAILVLGLSACGGGEKENETTDSSTTAPATSEPATENSTSEPETSDKKGVVENGVYTNAWANIVFKIPQGWIDTTTLLQEYSSTAAEFVFGCQDPTLEEGFYANVNIAVSDISATPQIKTAEEYASAAKQSLLLVNQAQGIECSIDEDLVSLNVCGEDYVAVRSECSNSDVKYVQYSICRIIGSDVVIITVSVPSDEAASDLMTFFVAE